VGSQRAIAGVQAIIDTGTTLIVAPEQDVVKFYQRILDLKMQQLLLVKGSSLVS
jgi:hypothetical protein